MPPRPGPRPPGPCSRNMPSGPEKALASVLQATLRSSIKDFQNRLCSLPRAPARSECERAILSRPKATQLGGSKDGRKQKLNRPGEPKRRIPSASFKGLLSGFLQKTRRSNLTFIGNSELSGPGQGAVSPLVSLGSGRVRAGEGSGDRGGGGCSDHLPLAEREASS